jgi:O-antigen/teichoic acid export membrane protein
MDRRFRNLIANHFGVGARLLLSLLFNVAYFRLLGGEGYGLVGLYVSLAMVVSLADAGLNQAAMREVALRAADGGRAGELRAVFQTFGLVAAAIGLLLGTGLALVSGWLAGHWLDLTRLAQDEAAAALALMGGSLALLLPGAACHATLMGLERQVFANAYGGLAAAVRGIACIAALLFIDATPTVFFAVQFAASVLEVGILAGLVVRLLPVGAGGPIDFAVIGQSWRFGAGAWLGVLTSRATVIFDKVLLSTLLPLELFGQYSLAVAVAGAFERLATPFTNAYFPQFVALFGQGRRAELSAAYGRVTRYASALFLAAGLTLAVHADLLGDLLVADRVADERFADVLALFALAAVLIMLTALPYSLQLAHGIVRPALLLNALRAAVYLPALAPVALGHGMLGAAALWLAVNAIHCALFVLATHRLAHAGPLGPWLWRAVLRPAGAAGAALLPGLLLAPALPPFLALPWLALNLLLALAAALFSVTPRPQLSQLFRGLSRGRRRSAR